MGLIKSQGLSNTIISYLGIGIGYINFLLLIPYAMLPEQIGVIRILQNSAAMLVPLAQLGTISIITRYYHFQRDNETQNYSFLSFNFVIGLIGFIAISLALIIFKPQIISLYEVNAPEITEYYNFVFVLIFFLLFFEIIEAIAANNFNTVFTHVLKQLLLRISITVFTVLFIFDLITFYTFITLMVASYVLSFLILVFYMQFNSTINISLRKFFTKTDFSAFSNKLAKEMLLFGAYAILYATGSALVNYVDTLMLGSMLGLEEVGIYSTVFYMAVVVEVPRRSISRIANPLVAEAWKNNDLLKIEEMYKKVSINQLISGVFVLLLIWLNLDYLFELIPNGEIYATGKYVVLLIMLGKLVDMAASLNGEIISYSEHYRFNIVSVLLLAVLAVITNLIFIPKYGINGAALATLISIALFNLVRFVYVWKKFSMMPFSIQTIKVIIISTLIYVAFSFATLSIHPILSILVISTCVSICFGICIYYSKVSEDINSTLESIYKKVMIR